MEWCLGGRRAVGVRCTGDLAEAGRWYSKDQRIGLGRSHQNYAVFIPQMLDYMSAAPFGSDETRSASLSLCLSACEPNFKPLAVSVAW